MHMKQVKNQMKAKVKEAAPEATAPKEKKRFTFKRLYIATAVCTAAICLVVLAVVTQVTRSVTKWEDTPPLVMPTPVPLDSLIADAFPKPVPTVAPTQAPAKTAPPQIPTPESAQKKPSGPDNSTVAAGSFGDFASFTLTMPLTGEILNDFSIEKLKKSKTMGDWRVHKGIDIKAPLGSEVKAVATGTIEKAYNDNAMGNVVVIKHSDSYSTIYANLASLEMAQVGKEVQAGTCIGAVGDSAVSEKLEEAHLHLELIENGEYRNPLDYLK